MVVGLLGIVWVIAWAATVRDRPEVEPQSPVANATEITAVPLSSIWFYIRQPVMLLTALAFFAWNYILYFFLSWFPSYLVAARGLSIQHMSIVTLIPWMAGFVGLASGGFALDWLVIRSGNPLRARKLALVGGLLGAAVCVGVGGLVTSATEAVALMTFALFCLYLTAPAYWTMIQDIVPSARVGGVTGFVHFLANTSGIIGPAVTGYIVQYAGGFAGAFLLAGAIGVTGALGVGFFGRVPQRSAVSVVA